MLNEKLSAIFGIPLELFDTMEVEELIAESGENGKFGKQTIVLKNKKCFAMYEANFQVNGQTGEEDPDDDDDNNYSRN